MLCLAVVHGLHELTEASAEIKANLGGVSLCLDVP
jgi:hypothetical protein